MVEKRLILIVGAVILLSFSIINLFSLIHFTGSAISSNTGDVQLCLDGPPTITAIADQSVTAGNTLSLTVVASDGDDNNSLTFYDNTSFFAIGSSTGIISFASSSAQVGSHDILITVEDDAGCLAQNSTDTFTLTVAAAAAEAAAPAAAAAGGGGGGAAAPRKAPEVSFDLSEEVLKVTLSESQSLERTLRVNNTGKVPLEIEVENPLSPLVDVFPKHFELQPEESRTLVIFFNPGKSARPDVYSGLLRFKGTYNDFQVIEEAAVVLEIESEVVLFDASVDVLKKTLLPGEDLKATITLVDLRRQQHPADVKLIYTVTDVKNAKFYEEEEIISLEQQASFSKTIPLPATIPTGDYVFSVKVLFEQSFATATEIFHIEAPLAQLASRLAKPFSSPSVLLLIPFLAVLAIATFVLLYFLHRKIGRQKVRTVVEKTVTTEKIIREKPIIREVVKEDTGAIRSALKRKLAALEEGHQKGFIREKSYQEAKRRLEQMLRGK